MPLDLGSQFAPWSSLPVTRPAPYYYDALRRNPFEMALLALFVRKDHPFTGPTYWPYFDPSVPLKKFGGLEVERYWRPQDRDFFDGLSDASLSLVWPLFITRDQATKDSYRNIWKNILSFEEDWVTRRIDPRQSAYAVHQTQLQYQWTYDADMEKLQSLVATAFDFEQRNSKSDFSNPALIQYLIPFYDQFPTTTQTLLVNVLKNSYNKTQDLNLLFQLRIEFLRNAVGDFPWNDATCAAYYPGYIDLTPTLKLKYQAMRKNLARTVYQNIGMPGEPESTLGDLFLAEIPIKSFEYDNSATAQNTYSSIDSYWKKIYAKQAASYEAAFKKNFNSILHVKLGGLAFIDTAEFAVKFSEVTAVLGAAALAVVAAPLVGGAIGGGLSGATGGAVSVGAGTTAGTAITAGTIAGGGQAIVGKDPTGGLVSGLVSGGKSLVPSVGANLGVDTTLPGGNNMDFGSFGNSILTGLGTTSLGGIADTVGGVVSGDTTVEDGLSAVGDALGGVTLGQVANATAATPAPASKTQPAKPTIISTPAAKASAGLGMVAALVAFFFFYKGK